MEIPEALPCNASSAQTGSRYRPGFGESVISRRGHLQDELHTMRSGAVTPPPAACI